MTDSYKLLAESIERLKAEIAETRAKLEASQNEIAIYNLDLKKSGKRLKEMEKLLPKDES